jgi:hypothetical protein
MLQRSSPERKRHLRKLRNRELRARAKERNPATPNIKRPDPLHCHPLWLRDSEAAKLGAGLKPDKAEAGKFYSKREWRELIGRVAAAIVRERIHRK